MVVNLLWIIIIILIAPVALGLAFTILAIVGYAIFGLVILVRSLFKKRG